MRSKKELEKIAEKTISSMPQDLTPSELGYTLSLMMKGHAIALRNDGL